MMLDLGELGNMHMYNDYSGVEELEDSEEIDCDCSFSRQDDGEAR